MPRRDDPERIYQAQRAGIFARLVGAEHVNELDAKHWIARWEREAEANGPAKGSQQYWDEAWRWIQAQRSATTKTDMDATGDDGQVYGG